MKTIRNPNEIVDDFVADFSRCFGENLISIAMYGSAVTHEYRPGLSDINMVIILKDDSISSIRNCILETEKWRKKRVATPFFMTREFITSSLDSYPIEFLDIKSSYRILFGEDLFAHLDIKREHLRLQCERELRGISIHLRKAFVESGRSSAALSQLLSISLKKLLPVFKAMILLNNKPVPKIKSDVIIAVEDMYNLGASALSDVLHPGKKIKNRDFCYELFGNYADTIDNLTRKIDKTV
jgi:hypothetical protein